METIQNLAAVGSDAAIPMSPWQRAVDGLNALVDATQRWVLTGCAC